VQLLRARIPLVAQRLRAFAPADIHLCSIVKAELFRGALRSARPPANRAKVDAFVQPYVSLPFDDAAAEIHSTIRHQLETQVNTDWPG
jgi:tRNA(fMet)-specific endonuclease VapC